MHCWKSTTHSLLKQSKGDISTYSSSHQIMKPNEIQQIQAFLILSEAYIYLKIAL